MDDTEQFILGRIAKLESDLAAYRLVLADKRRNAPTQPIVNGRVPAAAVFMSPKLPDDAGPPASLSNGNLSDEIRALVRKFDMPFRLYDIEDKLKEAKPDVVIARAQVSSALSKLRQRGEIEVAEEGSGRKPTIYRLRVQPASLPESERIAEGTSPHREEAVES